MADWPARAADFVRAEWYKLGLLVAAVGVIPPASVWLAAGAGAGTPAGAASVAMTLTAALFVVLGAA